MQHSVDDFNYFAIKIHNATTKILLLNEADCNPAGLPIIQPNTSEPIFKQQLLVAESKHDFILRRG